ncbi:MAG: AI-2E family transporter [Acidimicrobiales bacterium]
MRASSPSRLDDPRQRWAVPAWLDLMAGWAWRVGVAVIALYVIARALSTLRLVTVPLLFALVFSALLWPLRRRLCAIGLPDAVAVGALMLLAVGSVVGVVGLASYGIVDQLANDTDWAATRSEIERWLIDGPAGLSQTEVAGLSDRAEDALASGLLSIDIDRARLVGEVLGALLLTTILVYFFVRDGERLWHGVVRAARPERQPVIHRAGGAAFSALSGYARGVAIAGVMDGIGIGLALWLLGVPLALPLAILTFFASFVPIVGATSIGLLSVVVAMVTVGPEAAILTGVATLAIQQLEGNLILPAVVGPQVGLHPAVILVVLAAGGVVAGLVGALVAVPLAAMITAAVGELRAATRNVPEANLRDVGAA